MNDAKQITGEEKPYIYYPMYTTFHEHLQCAFLSREAAYFKRVVLKQNFSPTK